MSDTYFVPLKRRECDFCKEEKASLRAENEIMREALEWYADAGNYLQDDAGKVVATAWRNDRIAKLAQDALRRADEAGK